MKRTTLVFALAFSFSAIYAQNRVLLTEHFDEIGTYESASGVKGKALNLSAGASKRKSLKRTLSVAPVSESFSLSIWTKAASFDDELYTFLTVRNNKADSSKTVWELGKQPGGAWYWSAYTDKNKYDYRPTLQRQPINDGKWHQLVFTFNNLKKEARFYYDGKNVAIYYTPELNELLTKQSELTIGGTEKGDLGEWETFNGMIDEFELSDGVLNAGEVLKSYQIPYGKTIKNINDQPPAQIKVMNYNIYHGGNETGKFVGPMRIAEIIKESGADIISMQETYGSGARIADALGYYFYLRSSNLSIMSRFPIEETITGEHPFYNGGAHINLGPKKQLLFVANWLNFPFDYWDDLEKNVDIDSATWVNKQQTVNAEKLEQILNVMKGDFKEGLPVIFCGDFNTGSHLDWTEATRHLNKGYVIPFPSGILMEKAGFKDSYRTLHPDPLKNRGITWSPMHPSAFKDRIDYIYYKGNDLIPLTSDVIETHKVAYPSDHGAVLTTFKIR
nr:endonuclease/exonuclease/phosphatase family protein [Pedobacter panaciterrae]